LSTWDVFVASICEPAKALEPIRVDRSARLDIASDEVEDGGLLDVRDDLHPGSSGSTTAFLDGDKHERSLAPLELPTASQPCLRPAHPGVVEFDFAPQRFAGMVDHGSAKLVQNHPRRFVAPNPKLTLQQEC